MIKTYYKLILNIRRYEGIQLDKSLFHLLNVKILKQLIFYWLLLSINTRTFRTKVWCNNGFDGATNLVQKVIGRSAPTKTERYQWEKKITILSSNTEIDWFIYNGIVKQVSCCRAAKVAHVHIKFEVFTNSAYIIFWLKFYWKPIKILNNNAYY